MFVKFCKLIRSAMCYLDEEIEKCVQVLQEGRSLWKDDLVD